MWIKLTRAVAILVLALALQGCQVKGIDCLYLLVGAAPVNTSVISVDTSVIPVDTDVVVGTLFRHVQTTISPGQATVSGKAVAGGSGPAIAKATFPSQLKFTVQQKNSKNKLLATFSFNVTMDSDGVIPVQRFPFPGLVMNPDDSLLVSVTPLDADLPTNKLKMKLKYKASV